VIPELKSKSVLKKGKLQGFIGSMPAGTQPPVKTEATTLRCKYDQKNAKKNITSERINRSIPCRSPL